MHEFLGRALLRFSLKDASFSLPSKRCAASNVSLGPLWVPLALPIKEGLLSLCRDFGNPNWELTSFIRSYRLHSLEKEMLTHSSILVWRIPQTEEPGRLQSMGSQESDIATKPPPQASSGFSDWVRTASTHPVKVSVSPRRYLYPAYGGIWVKSNWQSSLGYIPWCWIGLSKEVQN